MTLKEEKKMNKGIRNKCYDLLMNCSGVVVQNCDSILGVMIDGDNVKFVEQNCDSILLAKTIKWSDVDVVIETSPGTFSIHHSALEGPRFSYEVTPLFPQGWTAPEPVKAEADLYHVTIVRSVTKEFIFRARGASAEAAVDDAHVQATDMDWNALSSGSVEYTTEGVRKDGDDE